MLAGTGSDVGKSVLTAGLCRIFLQDGYHPAPFKAQNMALNSFSTPDGLEIGRAQAVQAEACGIDCMAEMNPLLLKPVDDRHSQVVLNGKAIGNYSAADYFNGKDRPALREHVRGAFKRLADRYNPIVMEGAGSIAEINLRDRDLVNMPMAADAGAKVILVADIDRGGVFASAYGSIMLQNEEDRKRIAAIIVNKFRGDIRLFEDGVKILEEICGVPVLGVVPYFRDIHIEEEDSLSLAAKERKAVEGKTNIGVVLLPHLSNFTDFDALERHPGVNLFYIKESGQTADADIIILPGSKATISDLAYLRMNGFDKAIAEAHLAGKSVVGICGGFQMLGVSVEDPDGVESDARHADGLDILPVRTCLRGDKRVAQTGFSLPGDTRKCRGYEIHMGETVPVEKPSPFALLDDGGTDGFMLNEKTFGTYLHGVFDNPATVELLLRPYAPNAADTTFDYRRFREEQYDRLASLLRECLDIDRLYQILSDD